MKILITGAAGFIGSRLCLELIKNHNNKVYGIDKLDSYYSKKLKKKRLIELNRKKNFKFFKIDLKNNKNFKKLEKLKNIDKIKKLIKNFKFSNFDKSLMKTINWYNKNKIHKIT